MIYASDVDTRVLKLDLATDLLQSFIEPAGEQLSHVKWWRLLIL